jgi:enterobactin synthetase component D
MGIVGSITHTSDRAIAVVASARDLRGIGIDCERFLSEQEGEELAERVAPELPALRRGQRGSRALGAGEALSIVFSAKESLYKCLHPIAGEFFDFDDVRAESLDLDGTSGELSLVLGRSLGGRFHPGEKFRAAFTLDETHVVTVVELPNVDDAAEELLSTLRIPSTVVLEES